jgi:hypothetical protein
MKNLKKPQKQNLGRYNERSNKSQIVTHKQYLNSRSLSPNRKKICKDPFAVASKHKTNFGYVYSAGGIPCRLDFQSRMKIRWEIPLEELNFDPILEICFEGLIETVHPYCFVAKQAIKEMLNSKGADEKIIPLLPKLLKNLRVALANDNENIFLEAMDILRIMSRLVKEELNKYLFFVLQPINKRSFKLKYKERVFDLLRELENNGGKEAYLHIKSRVPSYNSMEY